MGSRQVVIEFGEPASPSASTETDDDPPNFASLEDNDQGFFRDADFGVQVQQQPPSSGALSAAHLPLPPPAQSQASSSPPNGPSGSGSGGPGGQGQQRRSRQGQVPHRRIVVTGSSGPAPGAAAARQPNVRQLQHQSLQDPASNSANSIWGSMLAEYDNDTSAPSISPTLANLIVKSAEESLTPDRYKRRLSALKKPENCQLTVARMPPNIWDGLPRNARQKDCILQEVTKDLISGISGIAAAVGTRNQPLNARLFGVGIQMLSGIKVKLDNFRKASLTGNHFSSAWKFLSDPTSPKTRANDGTFTDLAPAASNPLDPDGPVGAVLGARLGLPIRTSNAVQRQRRRFRPYQQRAPTPGRALSSSRTQPHSRSQSRSQTESESERNDPNDGSGSDST